MSWKVFKLINVQFHLLYHNNFLSFLMNSSSNQSLRTQSYGAKTYISHIFLKIIGWYLSEDVQHCTLWFIPLLGKFLIKILVKMIIIPARLRHSAAARGFEDRCRSQIKAALQPEIILLRPHKCEIPGVCHHTWILVWFLKDKDLKFELDHNRFVKWIIIYSHNQVLGGYLKLQCGRIFNDIEVFQYNASGKDMEFSLTECWVCGLVCALTLSSHLFLWLV